MSLLNEMADEDLDHFRPGILWAIGRLGPIATGTLDEILPAIEASLDQSDPQARGMAVWCLGQIGSTDLLDSRCDLLDDDGPASLYENSELTHTTVGDIASRLLDATELSVP